MILGLFMLLKPLSALLLKVFADSCHCCPKEMWLFPFADAILVYGFHICLPSPPALHMLNLCDLVKVSLFLIPPWQKKAMASWGHLEGIIRLSGL